MALLNTIVKQLMTYANGVWSPVTSGVYALRLPPSFDSSGQILGYHILNGSWRFSDIPSGQYKMYKLEIIEGSEVKTEVTNFAGGDIGADKCTVYISDGTIDADLITGTLSDSCLSTNIQRVADSIAASRLTGAINDDRLSANIPRKDGNNIWEGVNNFTHGTITVATPIEDHDPSTKEYVDAHTSGNYVPINGGNECKVTTPINFTGCAPRTTIAAAKNIDIPNWGLVKSEINARINSLVAGNYKESPNIVRLNPDGIEEVDKIYLTWNAILTNLHSRVPANNKQFTVEITGNGEDDNIVPAGIIISGDYFLVLDYVHWKGRGSNVKLVMPNFVADSFKAGALGRIIIEDLYLYFNDDGNTNEYENIIFKNCKFYNAAGTSTFISCKFEGVNEFDSAIDNAFSFSNCTGERITALKSVITAGSFIIPLDMPNSFSIGTVKIIDNNSRVIIDNAITTITRGYGQNDGKALTTPRMWLSIDVGGTQYGLPLYEV